MRLAHVFFQPIAGDDVAQAVGRIAIGAPVKGLAEVAGPERYRMDEFFRHALPLRNDSREVVTDPRAVYYGISPAEDALVPASEAILGEAHYDEWPGRTGATSQA